MISTLSVIKHENLPGVKIRPFTRAQRGAAQRVLVEVEPNAEIPLHEHSVDAQMFCVAGNATVLSSDPKDNGKQVETGNLVEFRANISHGFRAGKAGFAFVSENGGIVDESSHNWDITFTKLK